MDVYILKPLWTFYIGLLGILVIIQHNVGGQLMDLNDGKDNSLDHGMYKPKFKDTQRNVTVGPGDRAVLRCRVENLGTKTVTWRKATQAHPMTIGLFTFVGDTRVSVDYNQRYSEWSLIIQDVKPSDEGHYQCLISTKDHMKSYDIELNVKTVQVSGTEYVEKGSPVQLICNATGKPDPPHDVEWFKNGMEITSDAKNGILITKKIDAKVLISVLVISNSRMKDSGDYVCRSSNRDNGMIKVHILNVSSPNVKRSGEAKQRMTGSTASGISSTNTWVVILSCSLASLLLTTIQLRHLQL